MIYRVGNSASMIDGSTTDSIVSIIRLYINPHLLTGLLVIGAICLAAGMGCGKR